MLIFSIHLKKFSGLRSECQTFRSRSGPTKCWAWSGSKLFAKVFLAVGPTTIFLIIYKYKRDSFRNSEDPDENAVKYTVCMLGHFICYSWSRSYMFMFVYKRCSITLMTVHPSRKHSGWMAEKETVTNYNFLRANAVVSTTAPNP